MTGYNLKLLVTLLLSVFLLPSRVFADEGYTPAYSASPSGQTVSSRPLCQIRVVKGNNSLAPADVEFEVTDTDSKQLHYDFGDGTSTTGSKTMTHHYGQAGTYVVSVSADTNKDSKGSTCITYVNLKVAPLVSHKSECTGLTIESGNTWFASTETLIRISGYDNKGQIQGYKLTIDGNEWTDPGNEFFVSIPTAGSYDVKGFIQDTTGNWIGGTDTCVKTVQVKLVGMTTQPDTGVPSWFWGFVVLAGMSIWGIHRWKIELKPFQIG